MDFDGGDLLPFQFLLAPKDYRSKPLDACSWHKLDRDLESGDPTSSESPRISPLFRESYYRTKEGLEVPFSDLDVQDPISSLEEVAEEMDNYLGRWDNFLINETPANWGEAEIDACRQDRESFSLEIDGYRLGIEALRV